jgi:ElaB/YqjD/DUF883 family membrane-anchored ribosome-binding protein
MRELIQGLDGIVRQIDQLTRMAADGIGSRAEDMSEELTATLRSARERLEEIERDLQRALKRGARSADRYAREHPWQAIAIAAAAAFILGALLVSRSPRGTEPPAQT